MAVKEFLSKYKLYTILAVVVAVLVMGGITLGVLLSRNSTSPVDALDANVYIMADGTEVTSDSNYDFALDIYYSSESATVCRLDSVTRNTNSTATTIVIPETVTINGTSRTITTMYNGSSNSGAFYPVRSIITEVTLSNTITNIGNYAFRDCSGLTSINIPSSVTSIGSQAFQYCSSLTTVNIPDGVTSIGRAAFRDCTSLTTINIPDSVTSIGGQAFYDCSSLSTPIVIPYGVTSIDDFTFSGCSSLPSITIPDSVTSIGDDVFQSCGSLTTITIPDSVTSIGRAAFRNCTSLTSINIPASIINIEEGAFYNCTSLPAIEVDENNPNYKDDNGVLYTKDGTRLMVCPADTTLTEYNILDTTATIDDEAFRDCTSLTSINIPDGVTSIGWSVFTSCDNLTTVTIGSGVTSIGSQAFGYCSDLTNVYFYNDITSDTSMIGSYAFNYNNSNVTYWFKDQTSLDNAIAIDTASSSKFTGPSDHSNFKLMEWNVSVNCDENLGSLSYTEPASITYGTEITATVTPNGSAEFLYWEVKVTQNGNEIASDQIASTPLNYTITDFGTYTFTAVFDFNILITSESGGTEFDITRETNDGIVYTYSIKMKDGYSLNRIALISTDDIISSTDYQDAPATENYLNTNGFCTGFHYIVNDNGTELILEIVNITAPFIVYLGF